jgi:hypothetical protein
MSYYIKSTQFNKFLNIKILKPDTRMKPPLKHLQYQKIKPKLKPSPQKPTPQKPTPQKPTPQKPTPG